jgi:hypothetical protein
MSYRDVNEKIFNKLNELELKKVGKQIEKLYPEVVLRAFPQNKILNANQAVTQLQKETNLDENTIRNCLSELIERKELIPSKDSKRNLYLSKMKQL